MFVLGKAVGRLLCVMLLLQCLPINIGMLVAQDDQLDASKTEFKGIEPSRRTYTPPIEELVLLTEKSSSLQVVKVAIRSLKEFAKVRHFRVSRDAEEALVEMKRKANGIFAKYDFKKHNAAKHNVGGRSRSLSFYEKEIETDELKYLDLMKVESVAFVNLKSFAEQDLHCLHQLENLENITIEGCKRITGYGFRDIQCPNVAILHLNKSGITADGLHFISRKTFPKLRYINLAETKVDQVSIKRLRSRMERHGMTIQIKQ